MGYTKIIPVKSNLSRCLNYTANDQKTETVLSPAPKDLKDVLGYTQNTEKTQHRFYVKGYNCDPETAYLAMTNTKRRFGKTQPGHVLAYHVIQSFHPGEVTAEQAHDIACQFVERYLADRYEATVSTHLNCDHLHSHIVFNSVSFVDGKMFRNDFAHYYGGIQKVSDELCREHGLTVIQPKGKGESYSSHTAAKAGQKTKRIMVRDDVDYAISKSYSWESFVLTMKKIGYQVNENPNRKYVTVKSMYSQRWTRLDKLGEGYTVADIKTRLADRSEPVQQLRPYLSLISPPLKHRRSRYKSRWPPKAKISGFMALYYHYLYLFKRTRNGKSSRSCYYLLRDDFYKFDSYVSQFRFLWENHIETQQQLDDKKQAIQTEIASLKEARSRLYRLRGRVAGHAMGDELPAEIKSLTAQLRELRKALHLCDSIDADSEHIRTQVEQVRSEEVREYHLQQEKGQNRQMNRASR